MIEGQEELNGSKEVKMRDLSTCEVVSEVTTRMILADLGEGLTRDEIALKYAYKDRLSGEVKEFEKWMVDILFKDPALKNKRPAAKRKVLPFLFKSTFLEEEVQSVEENVLPNFPVDEEASDDSEDEAFDNSEDEPIVINS